MAISIFRFVVWFILGLICWINLQPWLDVGGWIAGTGLTVPFEAVLIKLPFIGGVFAWAIDALISGAASLIAIALWIVVQTLQIMALLNENEMARTGFDRLFRGIPLSQWVSQNSKIIGRMGWGSYALEGFVCFLAYPPYGSGLSDFIADAPNWDPYLLSWPGMGMFAVTILLFEGFVFLFCLFYGMAGIQPQQSRH